MKRPSVQELHRRLSLNPDTGVLTWRTGPKAGRRAGSLHKQKGYRCVGLDRREYKEHQVVWAMTHGSWPERPLEIDHRNRVKHDNRPENLRLVTRGQNNANTGCRRTNLTGLKGVTRVERVGGTRYRASIWIGRTWWIGSYESPLAAAAVHAAAHRLQYPEL